MLTKGEPVRVKLVDGSNHAGLVANDDGDEDVLRLHCIYKFVTPDHTEGFEEQVVETLSGMSTKNLLLIAIDLGVLKGAVAGGVIARRQGLISVLSTAMIEEMEPVLIAQQSPVNKVFPLGSILEISSLVDEGQERLFERWASNG